MKLKNMTQIILDFYRVLEGNEKKAFWFGGLTFAIGFIMLLDVLRPPSWWGWQETKGYIIEAQKMPKEGLFSSGSINLLIQYTPEDGSVQKGTFKISPVILSTMKGIRVFYQKDNPSVFYVHNPSRLVIALTITIFGIGVLFSFYLYYRDRLRGITYD